MEVSVLNIKGEDTGRKVLLNDSIFNIEPNDHVIYLDVKQYLANQRQGTAKSKERSEVSGSTRKLGRQKGGGGARRGDINSPVLVGGGRVFGPKPRDYGFKLNKKVKVLVGLFLSVGAYAQNITVKGHVKDALGGVIGANVVEKGNSTNGTITDLDGNFTLTVPQGATLVVSFIGYKTQEVAAAPSVIITLQDDAELLGEVVVIGYGTAKKNDLTGSVTAISADKMVKGAVTSATDMLVGKAAGVSVITDGGAPGAGATIRVRGGSSMSASNNPLIVIDGVPVDDGGINGMSNPLATVHPNDIDTR